MCSTGVVEPEERFAALAETFAGTPGVTLPGEVSRRRFGASALKFNGSIFAMLTRGQLVVKLPSHRVEGLITTGYGVPLDAGKGRPMRERLAVTAHEEETWLALAREALDFGRSSTPRVRR